MVFMDDNPRTLIDKVIEIAKKRGMRQKELAAAAGIAPEVLSRAKKKHIPSSLEKLAKAAGAHLDVIATPATSQSQSKKPAAATFRERHRTLVWSNPNVGDDIYIQRALLRSEFSVLLDAALEFGLPKVESEWKTLARQGGDEVIRSRSTTERILKHIRHGYEQVTA